MLTSADKKFLTENFATKKDLENFATKKETKELRDGMDLLRNKLSMSNLDKFDFKFRLDSIEAAGIRTEEKVDRILVQMDAFTGKVADLEQENKMGAVTTARHTRQIEVLARKTKVTLTE